MSGEDVRHIPIDIHLGQLLDWLISRRHSTKDWHNNLQKIREKFAQLYAKISDNASTKQLLESSEIPSTFTDILYVHCKRILDVLGESEHGSKNMLGQYQSPVLKELAEILKMYEKDNIYLAEIAQVVYRNITYDIPFIKKRMQKLDQTSAECAKKADDSAKSAKDFREQYLKECTSLGIEGRNIREELLQGARILPEMYDNIARRSSVLAPVCKFVEEFIITVHKGGWIKDQTGATLFPLLHHVMKYGNKPYPTHDEPLAKDTSANVEVMDTAPRTGHEEDDTESSQASLDVNLNDTVADHLNELNTSGSEVIDFDINDTVEEEGSGEVNWDLDTDGLSIMVEDLGVSSEEEPLLHLTKSPDPRIRAQIAEDTAFRNVLDNPELRTQLINELHELLAFLQRRVEEQSTEHMASELLNVQVGDSRLVNDKKMVLQLIGNVREVLDLFSDHRLQSLCKLHDSASFLDRLTRQLEQKMTFAVRMENRSESYNIHRVEAVEERNQLEPELAKLIDATRQLQKFVEQDISKKYQERRVTILGGIQSVA